MNKKFDGDWKPTRAVRNWAKRCAEKQYQRKGSRLVKVGGEEAETQSEIEALEQASSLNLSVENLTLSEPVSRTQSFEKLIHIDNVEKSKSETNLAPGHSKEVKKFEIEKVIKEGGRNTVDMEGLNEALAKLSTTVEGAVGGAYKDNYKTLPPLPYFNGETPKIQGGQTKEPWILYNCQDFLRMIENATNNDNWTDAGIIRTVQDKLLGVAHMYWEDRTAEVDTFAKAKEYLLARFPNIETFPTINRQIIEFKRKPGESISAMACRIQTLYNKLGEVAVETQASKQ